MKSHFQFGILMLSALLIFACSTFVVGQEVTGTINGTVQDSAGAAVPGASVTISDPVKKVVVRTIETNEEGQFSAPNLPSGIYEVSIEAANFKKHIENNVKLDVGQRRTVDVVLQAGNIAEVVTVEAAPLAVELTTPAVSSVINGDQVRELSINNRNFVSLVTLAPGITNDLDDLVFTGTNNPETQVVNRTLISVNGARSTQNTFTVDGADVTDRGSNLTIQAYPSVDSIGEFKVLRSLFPAESGRSGGGQVNVITRSGGAQFHGSAFEFIRNEAFNANDFLTNRTASLRSTLGVDDNGKIKRRPFRYNNYGFTIGGPVYVPHFGEGNDGMFKKLDRTFFFFSEEQRRDTRYPTISTRTLGLAAPTAQMKAGIFPVDICLSASSSTQCTKVLPAGVPLGSIVPVSNVAQQYVTQIWNKVPNPTDPAALQLDFPTLNTAKFRQEIIKIDHSFSDRWNAFYRYQRDKIPTIDADGSIGARSSLPFVNTMVSDSPGRTHTFQTSYTINPRIVLEGVYAYGYGAIFTDTTGLIAKDVSSISVPLPYENVRDVVPIVNILGFGPLQGFSNYNNFSWKQNFSGNVSWIRGSHTMKFGAVYSLYRKNENALSSNNQGAYSAFNNTVPSLTTPASVRAPGVSAAAVNNLYQSFANFLQGNNVTFTQTKLDVEVDLRQKNLEWFAQDEWRARQNLTVYYGVRYSYFGPAYDKNGLLSNFVPSLWNSAQAPQVTGAGNRVVGTGNFCNGLIVNSQNFQTGPSAFNCTPIASPWGKYVYQVSKHDYAPRFGLAWDPFKKGTTSIRTGYGIYHEQTPVSTVELLANNPPFQETKTASRTTMDNPVPASQGVVALAAAPVIGRSIQSDFKTPYMQHWSLDIQHQFGANTVFTVGYYGSKGTHLIGFAEENDLAPGLAIKTQCATNADTLQTPGVTTVLCQTPGTAFTTTPTILDQIRPFRGYRGINILETRYNSNYHSMQAYLQHRFTGASQLNVAYTWSKNLTDNQTSSVSTAPQDLNNIRAEYGRAILDRRHVFNANYVYELPFYREQKDLVGKLLGGWQASGIISLFTGLPFTVTSASYDPAGIGFIPAAIAGGRPVLLCDPNANAPNTINQWFNTACFAPQTTTGIANVPGDASRGAVDGPPTSRVDFTMSKNLRFGENVNVQLRIESFNVFNHTNFRNLSTARNATTFGQVTTVRDPRIMQFGLKVNF
ncbi:MAG TPA: carboxypeptidase regulatory-like domain-containing protein [Pyrinomonadaceae bacterium]|nr:carboxypeptidase regulatory-like domain-containing protein [Pyrinomonadaceae bacterium]